MAEYVHAGTEVEVSNGPGIWQRLRRNVSITVAGAVFTICAKIAQAFLLTRFLKIDDYGRVLIVTNFAVFLNTFVGVRVNDAIFRFFQALKEENNQTSIRRLVIICFGLCLISCLLLSAFILAGAEPIARSLYQEPGLASLLRVISITLVVTSFSGIYEPILRLYDRFSFLLICQVVGSLVTLLILSVYLFSLSGEGYDLRIIVGAILAGSVIQGAPPLFKSLSLLKPYLRKDSVGLIEPRFYSKLFSCLFYSNLAGYLKVATSPVDIFLLGIFSSPLQVAWYGLAKQFAAPLSFLEVTIQTAITPEIIFLRAKQRWQQLKQVISRYVVLSGMLISVLLVLGLVFGRIVFLRTFNSDYLGALPVFYLLLTASSSLTVLLVFRPLAVALDQLKWHNLALAVSVVLVLIVIATNTLSAMSMAYVQLTEAVVLRPMFGLVVWHSLRKHASQSQA